MFENSKLLIVDDDTNLRWLLGRTLRMAGYDRIIEAGDGPSALTLMARERPALMLLDITMPGISGFELVAQMRAEGRRELVLILTDRDDVESRIRGLEAGADDYLSKGFDRRELLARVQALLRRVRPEDRPRILRLGATMVDLGARTAERNGVPLMLTKSEFAMLDCLAGAAGQPVAREALLQAVWGYDAATNTRTLETHIWRLRKKICEPGAAPRWLVNRSGLGYVLFGETEAVAGALSSAA